MNRDELKLKVRCHLENIVDDYMPPTNIGNRLKNSTIKLYLRNNISKIDPILIAFEDANGDIDTQQIINHYRETLFPNGEMVINPKEQLPSEFDMVKSMLPDKIIVLHESDLYQMFQ